MQHALGICQAIRQMRWQAPGHTPVSTMNILLPTTDPAPHNNSNVQHCAAAEYLAFSAAATVPLVGRQSPQQTARAPRLIPQLFRSCSLTLGT